MPTKPVKVNMGPKKPAQPSAAPTMDQGLNATPASTETARQVKRTSVELPVEVYERLRWEKFTTGRSYHDLITSALLAAYPLETGGPR